MRVFVHPRTRVTKPPFARREWPGLATPSFAPNVAHYLWPHALPKGKRARGTRKHTPPHQNTTQGGLGTENLLGTLGSQSNMFSGPNPTRSAIQNHDHHAPPAWLARSLVFMSCFKRTLSSVRRLAAGPLPLRRGRGLVIVVRPSFLCA